MIPIVISMCLIIMGIGFVCMGISMFPQWTIHRNCFLPVPGGPVLPSVLGIVIGTICFIAGIVMLLII